MNAVDVGVAGRLDLQRRSAPGQGLLAQHGIEIELGDPGADQLDLALFSNFDDHILRLDPYTGASEKVLMGKWSTPWLEVVSAP